MSIDYIVKVSPTKLFNFCAEVFCKVGVSKQNSEIVSESLVLADLRGVSSHGVMRLQYYVEGIQKGLINPEPNIGIVKETANTAVLDGDNGLGQIAGKAATNLAIQKVKDVGLCLVGLKNINHVGMLAYYIMKIVKEGFIGLAFTNGPPSMAPWGGSKAMLGTNPLCLGLPIDQENSIILDMATSAVSAGKIASFARSGKKLPPNLALDKHGRPTVDPNEALKGTILPIGGYKGYGLSLAIDILAGILTGDKAGCYIKPKWEAQGGFMVGALNVNMFRAFNEYKEDVQNYVKIIKSCPLAEGFKEILLPGEPENRENKRRLKEGIPLDPVTWNTLQKLAKDLNISCPN